jgi:hypothetical protein
VDFEDALRASPAPRNVGDITLRYEESLLVGETRRRSSWASPVLLVASVACALAALAALLVTGTVMAAGALALAGGGLMLGAMWTDQQTRQVRRFVVNFSNERLRLETPQRFRPTPKTTVLPFDSVRDVRVAADAGQGFALEVEYDAVGAPAGTATLVQHVRTHEVEELRRLWRTLRAAFGLGARTDT